MLGDVFLKTSLLKKGMHDKSIFYFSIFSIFSLFQHIFSYNPSIRFRHCTTKWSSSTRFQILPVVFGSSGTYPWFGMHVQTTSPHIMFFFRGFSKVPISFVDQFFTDCTDVVGFKSTTSSNVSDTYVFKEKYLNE